jgi:hypothetical protein
VVIGEDFTNGNEHDVQIMHKAENKKNRAKYTSIIYVTLLNVI